MTWLILLVLLLLVSWLSQAVLTLGYHAVLKRWRVELIDDTAAPPPPWYCVCAEAIRFWRRVWMVCYVKIIPTTAYDLWWIVQRISACRRARYRGQARVQAL